MKTVPVDDSQIGSMRDQSKSQETYTNGSLRVSSLNFLIIPLYTVSLKFFGIYFGTLEWSNFSIVYVPMRNFPEVSFLRAPG